MGNPCLRSAMICPTCERRFEEGTFCPFDGDRLVDPEADLQQDDPLIGRILGQRYKLEQRIGAGGMGTVYRSLHVLMDKPIAVKVLRQELASDPYAAGRFRREARSASRIEHENCIAVTDFGQEEDGTHFLVMEYVEGRTLWEELEQHEPLPLEQLLDVAVQVTRALAAAHRQGVIHRDLKPENVMILQREGRPLVKVLDFGLAKVVQRLEEHAQTALTHQGMICGTPRYMSPEQAEGKETDPRSDLYSLGVMLYEMATGALPFEDRSVVALLNKHVHDTPIPPSLRCPEREIPLRLEQLILALLAKRPDQRPGHALEVLRELEEIGQQRPLDEIDPSAEAPAGTTPPGQKARSLGWLLPALGGAAAAVGITLSILYLTGTLSFPGHEPTRGPAAQPLPRTPEVAVSPGVRGTRATGPRVVPAPSAPLEPEAQQTPGGAPAKVEQARPEGERGKRGSGSRRKPRPQGKTAPKTDETAGRPTDPRQPGSPGETAPPAGPGTSPAQDPDPSPRQPEPTPAGDPTPSVQPDQLLREARAAMGRRQHEIAGRLLQRALNVAPGDPEVHMALANLHFERQRLDAALRSAQQAVRLRPDVEELMLLGQIAYRSGRRDLACRSFASVLELRPGLERARSYARRMECPDLVSP